MLLSSLHSYSKTSLLRYFVRNANFATSSELFMCRNVKIVQNLRFLLLWRRNFEITAIIFEDYLDFYFLNVSHVSERKNSQVVMSSTSV